jgi:flagellin
MSSVIYTNTASLVAQKNLLGAQNALATSVERLSSGLRINRARDDAAGLAVANSLQTQINGANQGIRNMNDAISMVQTTEGAIAAATDMAQRIYTLATQGANDTLGADQRASIVDEMNQLMDSIGRIASRTNFAGNELLTGKEYSFQISNESGDTIDLGVTAFAKISDTAAGSFKELTDKIAAADDNETFGFVQEAVKTYVSDLMAQRSELGAYQNQMEYTLANITELSANLSAAKSRVIDTDYAAETAALTRGQILQQAATAMLAQANQMPNVILTLLK